MPYFQIDTTLIQDIDLSRFVPQEVDNTGITVASMDRFTSKNKNQPTEEDNGERHFYRVVNCVQITASDKEASSNTRNNLPVLSLCLSSRLILLVLPAVEQMNGACGGTEANGLSGAEGGEGEEEEEEVPVDENLFTGEDLEELDEELNTLALED